MDAGRRLLKAVIAMERTASNAYEVDIPLDFCYGTVVHGGYEISVFAEAVQKHFSTALASYSQPHAFNINAFFLRPAAAGKAIAVIQEKSLGSGVSTTVATLSQKGTEVAMAYVSNTNMHDNHGVSYDTDYQLVPASSPADLASLATNSDSRWVKWAFPWTAKSFLKPYTHVNFYLPINGPPHPSLTDVWITPQPADDVFRTESLGFLADIWPRMVENYCADSEWSTAALVRRALRAGEASNVVAELETGRHQLAHWYPTLSATLEIKKLLPTEGTKWLFMRAQTKQVKNGRMDVEVSIFDAQSELVALSHQVCLVIDNATGPLKAVPKERKL